MKFNKIKNRENTRIKTKHNTKKNKKIFHN